jgi:Zn ribbon nucleic-acid-binding protein
LEEALFNIELVETGKSVHNIAYSQKLLSAAYSKMLEALDTIKSNYKPKPFAAAQKEIPTECSNCHAGIEEISASIFGLNFPHKKHLIEQKISCDTCHSNMRTHGEFIATKQSCATCHHKDTDKDCTSCHTLQKTLYRGGTWNGTEIPGDIMFEAGAECTDCHLDDKNAVFRSDKKKCLDCHEEGYDELFTEWQDSIKALIQSVTNALNDKKNLKLPEQDRQILRDIERTLQKLKLDGSSGVHNYMFMEEWLTTQIKRIESLAQIPQ